MNTISFVNTGASVDLRVSRLAFLTRINALLPAIYTAAAASVTVAIYKDKVFTAAYIDLGDPEINQGLHDLVTAGLADLAVVETALSRVIQDKERYTGVER